jgi:hypothetical protein
MGRLPGRAGRGVDGARCLDPEGNRFELKELHG